MSSLLRFVMSLLVFTSMTHLCLATQWHVNCYTGNNANPGSKELPFASLQKAINMAQDGDVIHLHPAGAVYRQSGSFRKRTGITIEGNGVTLDGADPLPVDGWEELESGLFRLQLPRTRYDRHLLIRDGVMERMGRTQSANSPKFPSAEELKPGQFCFENVDEKTGWLYVRGGIEKLEWSTRVNGIGTSGVCRNLTIRNLKTRNFLNDGFNVHGDCRELTFENIEGYDCFDEGFSAHESADCTIDGGRFWGNENGIADVNLATTIYRNCEFFGNVNVDVYLIGQSHSLIDCQILNTTSAAALIAGPRGDVESFELRLENVSIATKGKTSPASVRVSGGTVWMTDCELENVDFNALGATVEAEKLVGDRSK